MLDVTLIWLVTQYHTLFISKITTTSSLLASKLSKCLTELVKLSDDKVFLSTDSTTPLHCTNLTSGSYGNLLCTITLQKLPQEVGLEYDRRRQYNAVFEVVDLTSFVRKEVEYRECCICVGGCKLVYVEEMHFVYERKTLQISSFM